ncbi:MAG: TIM barrel protein, partial [Clostridia bacterium]|nr:TIM barrel protein [Clostridia bacterium]
MQNIGLQIYTIRDFLQDDNALQNAMDKIAAIGYREIQSYGTFEYNLKTANAAKRAGLKVNGSVMDFMLCHENLEELVKTCKVFDQAEIGIGFKKEELCDEECFRTLLKTVREDSRKLAAEGVFFSYHNHDREMERFPDGKMILDVIFEELSPEEMGFMPDTYWLQKGGLDVRHTLEVYGDRAKTLHLKDMKKLPEGTTYAEVGQGNLWWDGILETARRVGIRNYVVEQDFTDKDPL